jgi:HSP20 family protein
MFTRWQPFGDVRGEVARLQEEMSRLFDRWQGNGTRGSRSGFPLLNIWEDENSLVVEAELPGLEMSDLEIYITGDNQLSIKGERKAPTMDQGTWHRQERGFGAFSRLIDLPYPVAGDKVSAEFRDGVLSITLPKREEVKPRRIEVKVN